MNQRPVKFRAWDKKEKLKKQIGEELFNQLSPEDQELMIKTAGSIDFGYPIDLDAIPKINP